MPRCRYWVLFFSVCGWPATRHQTIVMRFVAVSVYQHDVSWTDKGLHGDLVGGRSTIRSEKQLSASKGPCCLFLGNPDIPSWFEQRIQASGRSRRFSQEDVSAIKMAEVTNPVRVENRLPSGNWQ